MVVDTIAATGLVLTAAQTLFAALQCQELKEMCSFFGYKSKLEELESTVSIIKAVLLDAESKRQELTHEGHLWVEKLKDAVYDADDLLDEFTTMARQWKKKKQGDEFSKKVLRFFSKHSNQLFVAFNISQDIKEVRRKLDSISKDRSQFGFGEVYAPIKRKEETCSYVFEDSIIGRKADQKALISMLLEDSDCSSSRHVQDNISFVTIVGIGGLGKTALAQLVYNDDRVKGSFEVKLWVCVSEEFGMKEILGKMLTSDMQQKGGDLGKLHTQVLEMIGGKKYLIVLDDVWEESHVKWIELRNFLIRGARGSRVLVTSRSKKVATAIGSDYVHELQGLSDEESWKLFEKVAFEPRRKKGEEDEKLVDIGKKVVKKCANVPLSIKVIGSLLYGSDVSKWRSFESGDLSRRVRGTDNDIMSLLKFSYYHLSPQLKSCFSYCALFPKDWVIEKEVLMDLWLAQSCLGDEDDGRSMEDVGEECFSMLLQRCFFQDVVRNDYGEIRSCKMHDLIHDLAQEVAGKESLVMLEFEASNFDHKIRHLSVGAKCSVSDICLNDAKTIRTFVRIGERFRPAENIDVGALLSNFRRVRVLDLGYCSMRTLHKAVGKLLHLRQLDLSGCQNIETLPKSIIKLNNLLVLKLRDCSSLRELPGDLRELIDLRHLDTYGCWSLTHMPAGMDSLTCLHKLSMFVVDGESSKKGQLRDLKALSNLRGELKISIKDCSSYDGASFNDGPYLVDKTHLKTLEIVWVSLSLQNGRQVVNENMLEVLQPYSGIDRISLDGYEGVELPSWAASLSTTLSCLVKVSLLNFVGLQHLPSLSQLPHLKVLRLYRMNEVEYMEDSGGGALSRALNSAFFPSLEELQLSCMYKLKGWWKDMEVKDEAKASDVSCEEYEEAGIPCFPRLRTLTIRYCGSMTSFPGCPLLKTLTISSCGSMTSFPGCPLLKTLTVLECNKSWSINNSSSSACGELYLEKLKIDDVRLMSSLFQKSVGGVASLIISRIDEESLIGAEEGFQMRSSSLVDLQITWCRNLKSIKGGGIEYLTKICDVGLMSYLFQNFVRDVASLCISNSEEESLSATTEIFQMQASSLVRLEIMSCMKLKSIQGGGIEYLTNLRSLSILGCSEMEMEDEEDGMPWKSLHSLSSLSLQDIHKVEILPRGFQYLTSLQTLDIQNWKKLRAIPEWISHLKSLRHLSIGECDQLSYLPEAMQELASLTTLQISFCEGLRERCQQPDGEDFHKIRHIPDLHLSYIVTSNIRSVN